MTHLSIIVPVFNLEEYLAKCLNSLLSQDIPNNRYEIIIINDGSTDNSGKIAKGFTDKYNNIIYIEKPNSGVSAARNAGIEKARGKYIMFVDGDDYIEDNCLLNLYNYVSKANLQVGLFGFKQGKNKNHIVWKDTPDKIIGGIELYRNHRKYTLDSSCVMLIETELLKNNNLYFTDGIPFLEDGEFIARLLCLAKNSAYSGYPYYVRVQRQGSATKTNLYYSKKAIDGFIKAAINLKNFQTDFKLTYGQKVFLNQPIVKFAVTAASACRSISTIKYLSYVKRTLNLNGLSKLDLAGCNENHYKFGAYYNKSIYYYFIYRFFENVIRSIRFKFSLSKLL